MTGVTSTWKPIRESGHSNQRPRVVPCREDIENACGKLSAEKWENVRRKGIETRLMRSVIIYLKLLHTIACVQEYEKACTGIDKIC